MKKIIFLLSALLIGFSAQAQDIKEEKKNKNARVAFEVDGICGMCKKRIETAALKTKGVKFNQCGWVDVLPKSFELLVSGTGAV